MSRKGKKGDNNFAKGLLTGIGAAIGIAAIGIGGKILYDKFNEKETPENKGDKEDKEDEKDEREDEKIEKPNNLEKNYSKTTTMTTYDEEDINGKESFMCPINQTLMEDPVITPYGTTYERSAILSWLKKHNNDPLTKKKLTKDMLIPNYALRSAIQEYKESLKKK